jgi:hypothetical protein
MKTSLLTLALLSSVSRAEACPPRRTPIIAGEAGPRGGAALGKSIDSDKINCG